MISITPQERRILTFLVAMLLVGCVVKLIRHHLSQRPPDVSLVSQDPPENTLVDSVAPDAQEGKPAGSLDINTATPEQLQSLSGIGPHLARRIVEHRDQHGPFSSPRDITAVRGIGEKTYERLRGQITVTSGETVPDEVMADKEVSLKALDSGTTSTNAEAISGAQTDTVPTQPIGTESVRTND
jgi:comEA protein